MPRIPGQARVPTRAQIGRKMGLMVIGLSFVRMKPPAWHINITAKQKNGLSLKQFIGNHLPGIPALLGKPLAKHETLCIETTGPAHEHQFGNRKSSIPYKRRQSARHTNIFRKSSDRYDKNKLLETTGPAYMFLLWKPPARHTTSLIENHRSVIETFSRNHLPSNNTKSFEEKPQTVHLPSHIPHCQINEVLIWHSKMFADLA